MKKQLIPSSPPSLPPSFFKGVTNEHFIVWMRTAGLPTFRKLYGKIDQDLPAGTQLSFAINPGKGGREGGREGGND
jgi:hypothetical protein